MTHIIPKNEHKSSFPILKTINTIQNTYKNQKVNEGPFMKKLNFLIYQFLLLFILLVLSVILDHYISRPFSYIDLIAILIGLPLYLLFFSLVFRVFKRFDQVRLRYRILLTIIAFMLAFISIALVENIWFETTGKMLFQLNT